MLLLLLLLLLQDGNDSGVINIPAVSNCLSLLMRDAGLMRFVKYVSAAAPGSRWVRDQSGNGQGQGQIGHDGMPLHDLSVANCSLLVRLGSRGFRSQHGNSALAKPQPRSA
jgi:hypothetical protein